jgi:hypothetical protein
MISLQVVGALLMAVAIAAMGPRSVPEETGSFGNAQLALEEIHLPPKLRDRT